MKIGGETSGERERKRVKVSFGDECDCSCVALIYGAQGALRLGASSSTPPNNYGFIVIML